ncbi:MAG: prepilin-type N-terminal cleavage/methylation domain-containing protein [Armatimonadetes bacterium]|nr:prepilin-type N-terminal cleavage/methylation domain-containing protein [Armatimonadota bacterium]
MKSAFTLIELLVVIAIIAILAAILFPVFAQAKAQAKQTACLSNGKQIGTALTMYLNDWDDKYPQEHPSTDNPVVEDSSGQLETEDYGSPFDKILPYVSSKDSSKTNLYICPTDLDPHGLKNLNPDGTCIVGGELPPGHLSSYILNAYYLFGATSSDLSEPARSIYISERRDNFCDVHYHPWFGETERAMGIGDGANPIAIDARRHNGGSNHVYADGHVHFSPFDRVRMPFDGHQLFGEFQAF